MLLGGNLEPWAFLCIDDRNLTERPSSEAKIVSICQRLKWNTVYFRDSTLRDFSTPVPYSVVRREEPGNHFLKATLYLLAENGVQHLVK